MERITIDKMELEYIGCELCAGSNSRTLVSSSQFHYVQCKNCNLVYLNPRPKQAFLDRFYLGNERFSIDIDKDVTGEKELYFFRFSDRLKDIKRFKEKGKILDIGCAWGYFLYLAKEQGWETYGVEPFLMQAEYARKKFNLNVFTGRLKETQFPSRYFDVITLFHVLEHIPHPLNDLSEIKRVLKEDGLLVIEIPSIKRLKDDIKKQEFNPAQPSLHLFYYSTDTLRLLVEKAGFQMIQIRECGDTELIKKIDDLGINFIKTFIVRYFRYFKWLKRFFQWIKGILKMHKNIIIYIRPL